MLRKRRSETTEQGEERCAHLGFSTISRIFCIFCTLGSLACSIPINHNDKNRRKQYRSLERFSADL
eukprot:328709-Hanusia_phi.AAC.2